MGTSATRAVGVELAKTRHAAAITALAAARQGLGLRPGASSKSEPGRPPAGPVVVAPVVTAAAAATAAAEADVELVHGDILQVDISDATVIYLASLCFEPEFMSRLRDRIVDAAAGTEYVLSLQRFPGCAHGASELPGFELVEQASYQMSWGDADVFIYRRSPSIRGLGGKRPVA